MPDEPRVVFLFGDGDVHMFPSLAGAEDWMEAIDVDNDEYTAALTETGRVIRMRTEKGLVVLELTEHVDTGLLQSLLRQHGEVIGQPGIVLDPVGFATQSWRFDWEHRWPRWPRWPQWLDKRLHPHGPVQA